MAQREPQRPARSAQQTANDPAILASGASVALSLYYFFVRGNHDRGLFVGLWAPTILAFASYFKQSRVDAIMRSARSGGLRESVQRIVQGAQ